jgi:hypothetical protein
MTSSLGISLFEIAETFYELFTGDVVVVCVEILLSVNTSSVDQSVGISRHAGNSTYHRAIVSYTKNMDSLIENVEFLD